MNETTPHRRPRPRPTRRLLTAAATVVLASTLALTGCSAIAQTTSAAADTSTSIVADAAGSTTADASTTVETIASTTAAAEAFIATLSDDQVEQLTYDYDDETKSTSWSNFPVTFVERGNNMDHLHLFRGPAHP